MSDITKKSRSQSTRRGRPYADPNQDYKQLIMDSAEKAFANSSFDSVSLKDIAAPVGVSPAMIHYYFGSKQDLLESVVNQAVEPMSMAIRHLREQPEADIPEFVQQLFATMQRHPHLPLLMFRQVLLPGSPMQSYFVDQLAPHLGGALPDLIRKGQNTGHISDELNPAIAALMVLSLCVFPLISKPLSQPALGVKFDQPGIAELQQHVIRFIQRGLQQP